MTSESIDPSLHVCVDRLLTPDQLVRSWYEATRERPSNTLPVIQRAALSTPHEIQIQRLGVFVAKHWGMGQVIPISFAPGTSRSLLVKLMTMANETGWPGNLKYRDVPRWEDGEIRVAFIPGQGSYSYIGTDCRLVPKSGGILQSLTLNLGWIDERTDDQEVFRTWVHELGHARGYPHNQSLPNFDVPLRRDYMIQWYMKTQGWSRESAEAQFELIAASLLKFSSKNDVTSLMQYPIPAQFVETGVAVPMNTVLSTEDKRFDLEEVYPYDVRPPVIPVTPTEPLGLKVLLIGGPPVADSIGVRKEVDWWNVIIQEPGIYRFRTEPAMVLGLFLSDKSRLLAPSSYGPQDDRTDLLWNGVPGNYCLGVKHHLSSGIGPYYLSASKI